VLGNRAHNIVADSSRDCSTDPSWVAKERVETTVTAIVEIDVDSAVEMENEVADRVSALNGIKVRVEGYEEPGVFYCDKGSGHLVGPELVLVVIM